MASLRIVLGSILLACALGIAMDMVTAHVAVEHFTVHHPRIVDSQEPVVMALLWGIGASWWFGAIAGIILDAVNRRLKPQLTPKRVLQMVARTCVVLWILMMAILGSIYAIGSLVPMEHRGLTFESDRRLMAVALTHLIEYGVGGAAVIVLAFRLRVLSGRSHAAGKAETG